jgi:hypothetical protein
MTFRLILGLAAAGSASIGLAQSAPLRVVPSPGGDEPVMPVELITDANLAGGRAMADCAVKRDDGRVRRVLQTTDGTQFGVSMQALRSTLDRCITDVTIRNAVGADYSAQPMIMVGLLAEALLEKKGVPSLVPAVVNPDAPQLDWLATSPAGLVQLRLAECLAARHPSEVAAFVSGAPGSPAELAGFRSLAPHIGTCLDSNVTLSAKRAPLKLAMAYAYYRRTLQPGAVEVAR